MSCPADVAERGPDRSDRSPLLLTPEEAAKALGIGRWKLYDLLRRGELASVRIGSCRRIPRSSLEEFIAQLRRDYVRWPS